MRPLFAIHLAAGFSLSGALKYKQEGYFGGIRLVDGGNEREGRVEVNWSGEWGTVCDDDWDIHAATVVCKMLGYTEAEMGVHSAYFGMGNDRILLDNVHCDGSEKNITDCTLKSDKPFGDSDCQHHEDAGVICKNERIVGYDVLLKNKRYSDYSSGGRLLTRLRPFKHNQNKVKLPIIEGLIETKTTHVNATWRKACIREKDPEWTYENAFVVCGQLGFPDVQTWDQNEYKTLIENEKQHLKTRYNKKKPFVYSVAGINCTGSENEISWCLHRRKQRCTSDTPIVIRCKSLPSFNKFKDLSSAYKEHISRNKGYGRSRGTMNLGISGIGAVGEGRYTHGKGGFQQKVRLRGGDRLASGRVELVRRGRWGSVCDGNWTIESANVVCREMGFGSAFQSTTKSTYGPGHNPLWISQVQCDGSERSIFDCPHKNVSSSHAQPEDFATSDYGCSHDTEVAVTCHTPDFKMDRKIRVVGGRNPREGRVEMKVKGRWGSVCSDDWTILEAMVVCRQLGLGYAQNALFDTYFYKASPELVESGQDNKVVVIGLQCTGSELGLHDCVSKVDKDSLKMCRKNSNDQYHVAGIMCQERAPDLITDVPYIMNTVHITETPVYQLVCAHEEGCLAKSADDEEWPYSYNTRKLLRFSTRTWNRGVSAFLPDLQPDQWEWHACHRHYHSMSHFIDYDILSLNGTKVAAGHKASFCLEDVDCYGEGRRAFRCGRQRGGQGISVGCADVYKYNLDCQWIDITDVEAGNYLLRLNTNPEHNVAESDFMNNDIICNLKYTGFNVFATNCHIPDDYVPGHLDKYYTEQIYDDWRN